MRIRDLAVIVGIMLATSSCRSKAQKEAYEQKRKALVEDNARKDLAEKAEKDAAEARLRAACNNDKLVSLPTIGTVAETCQSAARSMARKPSSVEFPSTYAAPMTMNQKGCGFEFYSYFDAQNALGQMVRTNFKCSYDARKERATVTLL